MFRPEYSLNVVAFHLAASLLTCHPAVRPGCVSPTAPVFHTTKVITLHLQNCCFE